MCGIVGYVGVRQAAPILLDGLSRLEYRGYDSAGIAVRDEQSAHIEVVKAKGRLTNLMQMTDSGRAVSGTCGIGHTRWATHGEPSALNAHPHYSKEKRVVIVHNGIIENYQELRESLVRKGYTFSTQTDTEAAALLLDSYYAESSAPSPRERALEAIRRMMIRVRGSYALGILFGDQPGVLYAARKDSPLIIGRCEGENEGHVLASDVPAVLGYTRQVVYIDNLEIACLTREELHIYNIDGEELEKPFVEIRWDAAAAEKDGFEHFMMKEIHEQPRAVRDTLSPRIREEEGGRVIDLSDSGITDEALSGVRRVLLIGCGSAYHVGMAARTVIEQLARVPADAELASEFRYRGPILEEGTLAIVISQSGETADSLAALRLCRERGVPTLAVVNVVGSSIAREADSVLYTQAGPEISVASTKAMCSQMLMLCLMALYWGERRGVTDAGFRKSVIRSLLDLPGKLEKALPDMHEKARELSRKYARAKNFFYLGRGHCYPMALEGALKLKELSYIHAEGYAAGEMKHGPIALIDQTFPTFALALKDELLPKVVSNIVEIQARQGRVITLTNEGCDVKGDDIWVIPDVGKPLTAFFVLPALQLFSYETSDYLGKDVDQPRNLAKSVTVE